MLSTLQTTDQYTWRAALDRYPFGVGLSHSVAPYEKTIQVSKVIEWCKFPDRSVVPRRRPTKVDDEPIADGTNPDTPIFAQNLTALVDCRTPKVAPAACGGELMPHSASGLLGSLARLTRDT